MVGSGEASTQQGRGVRALRSLSPQAAPQCGGRNLSEETCLIKMLMHVRKNRVGTGQLRSGEQAGPWEKV